MKTHSWTDRPPMVSMVAVLLALTGCVSEGPLGVRVRGAQTDVAFGAPTRAPLPNFPAPATAQVVPPVPPTALVQELFPDQAPPPSSGPVYEPPLSPSAPACPDAGLNDFPEAAASSDITTLPKPGQYRWKQSGKQPLTPTISVTVSGFQSRYLRRVTSSGGTHTFQMLQQDQSSGRILASTFRVKRTSGGAVDDAVNPVGLSLIEVDSLDAKGEATPVLQPNPPLVYLPLPVTRGASFSSRSIDGVSGAILTMDATVHNRQRIDACGDLVDGWAVTSTQSFTPRSGGSTTSRSYDYVVATQLGGTLVAEHAKSGSNLDVRYSLGQLTPDALPAKVK